MIGSVDFGALCGLGEHRELQRIRPVRRRVTGLGVSAVLHGLGAVAATMMAARFPIPSPTDAGPDVAIIHLADIHSSSSSLASRPSADTVAFSEDLGIQLADGDATLAFPGFKIDFGKVVKKANVLFPFLTGRVSLDQIVATRDRDARSGLINPFGQRRSASGTQPPLTLRGTEMQQLLDKCWSRRDRWQAFQPIALLTESQDANAGDLPMLLRSYVTQDGLQPYVDTRIRDPRLWAQLGLAADHADFIDFISRYVAEHGSTRVTTELLFLLDMLVQASFDSLTVLVDSDPPQDLQWTGAASRDAYKAVIAIRDYYRAYLERLDLRSPEALKGYYDEARLAVLNTILDATPRGYRASDARLAIGAIEWKRGRKEAAIAVWSEMTISPGDADAEDASDILAEIHATPGRAIDIRRINRVLEGQRSRWISRSYDRLRKFGYRFDTF